MSHIVTIPAQIKDPLAVGAACRRLSLPEPVQGTAKLFSGEVSGLLVQLRDWLYPVVIDTATGQVHYDNYGGRWGDPARLDTFLQAYVVERTILEARTQGLPVTEQRFENGDILVEIVESA